MTDVDIGPLTRLLPQPAQPSMTGEAAGWGPVEASIGLRLPSDYKAFIGAYGSGTIADFWLVLNPFATGAGYRLQDYGLTMLETLRSVRADGEAVPYQIHPEPGGLLPWGYTGNGDWCFWVTDPSDEPDAWAIAINGSRSPDWFDHAGPLVGFLVDFLSRRVQVSFLPPEVATEPIAFHPLPL